MRIACESGSLAWWVKRSLQTTLRDIIVCDRRRTRLTIPGASKNDRIDADALSECLRLGTVHPVYVPQGDQRALRRLAKHYERMIRERSRCILRLKALFLELGVRVRTPRTAPQRVPMRRLSDAPSKLIARAYIHQIECITRLVREARDALLQRARAHPVYALLQTIPYVGEIRAANLIASVGDPRRFGSRRQVWAYGGLAVVQRTSSEHVVQDGRVVRTDRTRGISLAKSAQPAFKKVLRDIALHASFGRGVLRAIYDRHLARGKSPGIARIALARKIATIVFAIWRYGRAFDAALLRKRQKTSGRASKAAIGPRCKRSVKATQAAHMPPRRTNSRRGAG